VASKVDIWNLALSHIGHTANVTDPDETSAVATHCRRFYPIALGTALERNDWSFARRRLQLAEVTNPVDHWAYAYSRPNLCVKERMVFLPGATDDNDAQPFAVESDEDGDIILLTNVEDAILRYTALVSDTNKFSYLFVLTLSYDLASMLVGPVPKDVKLKKAMADWAAFTASEAAAADANAAKSDAYANFIPSHLAAR
jgi:hypothetical protein